MKKYFLIFLLILLPLSFAFPGGSGDSDSFAEEKEEASTWDDAFGQNLNDSFYFVIDIIIKLRETFIETAYFIGRIVFIIAVCLAALNYAITGTGLKDNIVKITKATLFFLIIMFCYPRIVNWITTVTFDLSYNSVGGDVQNYFTHTETLIQRNIQVITDRQMSRQYVGSGRNTGAGSSDDIYYRDVTVNTTRSFSADYITYTNRDTKNLFGNLTAARDGYTVMQPAAMVGIIFYVAGECFNFAKSDSKGMWRRLGENISEAIKGLIMGFFVIFTGIFAILEYIICFLEFMLVTSVGIILFPFTIWEGSKFWAEKFVGAVLGFTVKLLFVNIAIFLLCYGYINVFYFLSETEAGTFKGEVGEMVFVIFSSLMFFYICKSAPAVAQGLLTGTPSLSATGAVSAVAGAVGGAMAVGSMAKSAAGTAARGTAQAAFHAGGALTEAGASAAASAEYGGTRGQQAKAFFSSLGHSVGNTFMTAGHELTRSLLGPGGGRGGGGSGGGEYNPHSNLDWYNNTRNADGSRMTLGQYFKSRAGGDDNTPSHSGAKARGMKYSPMNPNA